MFSVDVVLVPPPGWPEAEIDRGWSAARATFERLKGSWVEERLEITELVDVGGKTVLGYHWVTRGETSGIPIKTQMYAVYTIADLIERAAYFTDRAEAFACADEAELA